MVGEISSWETLFSGAFAVSFLEGLNWIVERDEVWKHLPFLFPLIGAYGKKYVLIHMGVSKNMGKFPNHPY